MLSLGLGLDISLGSRVDTASMPILCVHTARTQCVHTASVQYVHTARIQCVHTASMQYVHYWLGFPAHPITLYNVVL